MKEYRQLLISSMFVLFACLGLGRFGFGIILPNLQESLNISTTAAGFIGTANFAGYLCGLFFVGFLYRKIETDRLISGSLILLALSMFLMSLSSNYLLAAFLYTFSGFFTSIANVSIMVYIAHIIPQNLRGKALGIIVIGNGLAIIFSGLFVPIIELNYLENAWRVTWFIFALLILFIAFFVKKGLSQHDNKVEKNNAKAISALFDRSFWKISCLYFIFGITYVIYVTFFVTAAIAKYDLSIQQTGYFWLLLGVMSLFSGPAFGAIADKIGGYKTLIINYFFLTISYLLLTMEIPSFMLFLSVTLFGMAAWVIPSLVTLLTSLEFGKEKTAQVFSLVTVVFAIGQTIGPIGAGFIYDSTADFSMVFLICAILTALGMLLSFIFSILHPEKTSSH